MIFTRRLKRWQTAVAASVLSGLVASACSAPLATRKISNSDRQQGAVLCGNLLSPLSDEEADYAQAAWRYFENNYQSKTGFVNSADQYPSGTLWDMGNYLMALNAVRWLGFINQSTFDARLNSFLDSMEDLPLVDGALPNKVYNSATGEMVDYGNQPTEEPLGWSALDIGRLLSAFHIVRTCHPQYDKRLSAVVEGWQLQRSVKDGSLYGTVVAPDEELVPVQEGRLGYEEYAARGYALWGFDVPTALALDPMKQVKVEAVSIPVDAREFETTNANNYVVSESYILDAIEFGWSDRQANYAAAVFEAQKQRYEDTGLLTAVSEDNIDQPPHFLYSTVYANGMPWAVITEDNEPYPELRTLSTKAAFGWHYLFPKDVYGQQLIGAVADLQASKGGYYAGIYEVTGEVNEILTSNTNGLILEILYFKARGNRPLLEAGR